MSNILIVGNIVKDVYLRLDAEPTELDENGTPWLDIAFDGTSHRFSQRTAIFAGAKIAQEILGNFGLSSVLPDNDPAEPADDYRYILCHDDHLTYLTPESRRPVKFSNPSEEVSWIFVDRSAGLTTDLVNKIENYLNLSRRTRLAAHLEIHDQPTANQKRLAELANLIFTDYAPSPNCPELKTKGLKVKITEDTIDLEGSRISYSTEKAKLFTHLTTYSIISSTIFAALLSGRSVEDAIILAKLNVENSKLTGAVSKKQLDALVQNFKDKQAALPLIAKTMLAQKKGILAADESGGSIHKKFETKNIPDDEPHRRAYRDMLLMSPDLNKYIGGVILFDETARQNMVSYPKSFISHLTAEGIVPGIKTDGGLAPLLGGSENETYTKGLDGLPARLKEYYDMGLRFAKWRAAYHCQPSENLPSVAAMKQNAEILAVYARECQEAGIVPIVEPELVHAGNYSLEDCKTATTKILQELFAALAAEKVKLESCILKVNMVLAGSEQEQSTPSEVGQATAEVLKFTVPENLAGVVFLSGGQTPEQATNNLEQVIKNGPFPWPVTFSFARALQDPALDAWAADPEDGVQKGAAKLIERLEANCAVL